MGDGIAYRAVGRFALALTAFAVAILAGPTISSSAAAMPLTIAAPAAGSSTNNQTPTFSGTTEDAVDPVTVKVYEGAFASGLPVESLESEAPPSEDWSAQATTLAAGTYTVVAEQVDTAASTTLVSGEVTFTVDITAPIVRIDPVTSPTNNATPKFTGSAGTEPGDVQAVAVTVYEGASAGGPIVSKGAVPVSEGSWTYTPSALADGTYTVVAVQNDEAGNVGESPPVTFVVDTTKPAVTLSPVPAWTNAHTIAFSGGAGSAAGDAATVTVTIHTGSSVAGSVVAEGVVAASEDAWSYSPPELTEGTYTVQAEQSDEAGNIGRSAAATFTVDRTAPDVAILSPSNNSFLKAAPSSFGGSAGSAPGDQTAVTLRVYTGSTVSGTPQTLTASRSGSSWTASTSGAKLLDDTPYTLVAEQSDEAGNSSTSTPVTFTFKAKGPAVSLTPLPAWTNNNAPTFGGAAGAAYGDVAQVKFKLYAGGAASGTPLRETTVVPTGSTWSLASEKALPDGTYTARAEQSDLAENTVKSTTSTFIVDTHAPSVSLAPGATERHTSTPRFEGTAGVAPGDLASVTLNIYAGGSVSGAPLRSVHAARSSGSWSLTLSPGLPNGVYTAQAEQGDEAGNVGTSSPSTFTIKSSGPIVTLAPLPAETNDASPSFSGEAGVAAGDLSEVTLKIYAGGEPSGEAVREVTIKASGGTWVTPPIGPLPDGTYTALAEQVNEQSNKVRNTGTSEQSTFTIDTLAPSVSLTAPAGGSSTSSTSQIVEGAAGVAPGDSPTITVRLVAGPTIGGTPLETRVVSREGGHWQVSFEGLAVGAYTVQAEQSDEAGNIGHSEAVMFSVSAAPPPPAAGGPPAASFSWQPAAPVVGETVTLLSSSTDASSPITAFAWDVSGTNAFNAGGSSTSTSFSTPGNHLVHLRVTAADGLSSIASETIPVAPAAAPLMQPFPIVRIVSTDTASGIRLKLLRVQAGVGARIVVRCKGRGCPAKSQQWVATPAKTGLPAYRFRRFERPLRAGVVLEVHVSKAGQIGKYTRLVVKRGRLPERLDECLDAVLGKPMECP